jgi:nitrogen fixation protein
MQNREEQRPTGMIGVGNKTMRGGNIIVGKGWRTSVVFGS